MDSEQIKSYIANQFETHRRLEDARIDANFKADKQNIESHRHQHYQAERAHAELHAVHEDAHKREHDAAEVAILKSESQMQQRLQEMNDFKDSISMEISQFITAKYLENKLENYVSVKEFASVKALVYGAVALVMTSVGAAVMAILFTGNGA